MGGKSELTVEARSADAEVRSGMLPRPVLRVLMAAGGTGGHIFPALAIADEMRSRSKASAAGGSQFETLFLGTGRGLEARVIPAAGYPLETITAAGLKGMRGWGRIANLAVLPRSGFEAAKILRRFRPEVVVGMGGYISGPVMLEAALAGIPTLLFEPNAVPGFTNRALAPVVRMAAIGFQKAAEVYGVKARLTGHPVRREFYQLASKIHAAPYTVLIVGGSQGARALNQCQMQSLSLLRANAPEVRFIHQTGQADYNAVQAAYDQQGIKADVHAFIDNVPQAFAQADLVVCRAGATTVAELAAAGKASILIPYPSATDQHQLENARVLERAGGARLIEQSDLTPEKLVQEIRNVFGDPQALAAMEQKVQTLARPDAAARIGDLIEELGAKRRTKSK